MNKYEKKLIFKDDKNLFDQNLIAQKFANRLE